MIFNWLISIGDIIAFCSLVGSIVMFILTSIKQGKTQDLAQNANAYNDSAKKYYDLMVEQLKQQENNLANANNKQKNERAYCDANIVKIGSNKWILKLYNSGNEVAKDISFKYLVDDDPIILRPSGEAFPIKLLEPQKNVDYHLLIYGLKSASWDYEITWINKDGTTDSKKGVLTLPLT